MILKNRIFIITILAILSLNSCGDRAANWGEPANKVVPVIEDKDGDGYNSDADPDDNDPCNPSIEAGTCDQDNDGLTNNQESLTFGTDPKNPDTDGDGLLDGYDEALVANTSNPLDSCDPSQLAGYRGYNNSNALWQVADCDGDGYLNGTEDNISLTPNNYLSDPYDASSSCFTFKGKNYCEVDTSDGRTWLDKDLGSPKVCETYMDSTCYGNLYQWGRGTDGHQERNATARNLNPDYFPYSSKYHETSSTGNFDWLTIPGGNEQSSGFIAERKASWSSVSDNSVCPKGWYVPTKDELTALADAEGIVDSATAFSSPLRFAVSGSRSNASATIEQANVEGYIWTTDTSDNTNTSYAFTYTEIETLWSRAYRATGYSVRCIKRQ